LLCQINYLSSYSHRGQYYTLPHIPDFDHYGLWSFQGEFVPPHYVNNIRLFTKKVVKRFRMMYVNGQVLLQSGG